MWSNYQARLSTVPAPKPDWGTTIWWIFSVACFMWGAGWGITDPWGRAMAVFGAAALWPSSVFFGLMSRQSPPPEQHVSQSPPVELRVVSVSPVPDE